MKAQIEMCSGIKVALPCFNKNWPSAAEIPNEPDPEMIMKVRREIFLGKRSA